jgi:Flp pilus assembly pilin Flp
VVHDSALTVELEDVMSRLLRRLFGQQVGAAMAEYALIIAGVALIGAAAVAVFGHKVTDMLGTAAAVMPGAHADDNAPIVSGKTIETSTNTPGFDSGNSATGIGLDVNAITQSNGQSRLGDGVGGDGQLSSLVLETKNK